MDHRNKTRMRRQMAEHFRQESKDGCEWCKSYCWLYDHGLEWPLKIDSLDVEEYYEQGCIRMEDLKDDTWYIGLCRNAHIAVWNATEEKFWYLRRKFDKTFEEPILHFEEFTSFDVFVPIKELEIVI